MAADPLQDELDALAVRLGRSLTIDGLDGELLAYSTQRDDADQTRIASILLRHVAPEVRDWETRHLAEDATGPACVPANPELGMAARICLPLRRADRMLGYLWMLDPGRPLTVAELAILGEASATLAGLLVGPATTTLARGRPIRENDALVRRLFENGQAEASNELAAAAPELVTGTVRAIAVVAARPAGGGARALHSKEFSSLAGALTPILRARPGYIGTAVSTTHVLLVVHQRRPSTIEAALPEIDTAVRGCLGDDNPPSLGISDPVPLGVRPAREARTQAVTAAELASLDPALQRHCYWSRLGAYRTLIHNRRAEDRVLTPLDEAGPSAPMLLETLETFLDLGGDIQRVAARLRLHRSSLYYRLERISQLLSTELSDGLSRLELHLALKGRRAQRRTIR